ncbi:MAG TPA: hypothetical protein VIK89_06350, partial [Cytophagaceae bacterium]
MINQLCNFFQRKVQIIFHLSLLLVFPISLYSQNWSYDTLSEKKESMNVAVNGNKIFFHSGSKKVGSSQVRVDKIDIFDIQTGIRTTIPLPEGSPARTRAATAVVGNKVLFAGGNMGGATNWVDMYDTITGTWTSSQLSLDRSSLVGAAANGKAFFGGGFSTSINNEAAIVDIYNSTTDKWTSIYFSPAFGRANLTATSLRNKVFFAGGGIGGFWFNTVMIYDAEANKWLPNATLSQPKDGLTSLTYKNKIYFIGGTAWNQSTDTTFPSDIIDIYDDATDSWSTMTIPRLMTANYTGNKRAYIKSAQAGCKMFLVPSMDGNGGIGGMTPGNGDTIAVYDFARDSWSYLALPHPRTNVTIAAAKNKVYFAGGSGIEPAEHQDVQRFNHIDILTLEPKLQLSVDSTSLAQYDFGPVLTGEEETITINISNEGNYDLLFEDFPMRIDITGDVEDFTIDAAMLESIDTLAPAEIISLPVTF